MINCFDRLRLSLRLLLFGGLLEHEAHDSGNHAEYKAYHEIHVKEAGAQNGHAGKYYAHDKKYFFRHFYYPPDWFFVFTFGRGVFFFLQII